MNMTFGVGNILGTGFRVWFRNLVPFLLITAIFYAPPWIWAAIALQVQPTLENLQHVTWVFNIVTVLIMLLNVFVSAVLTYGVVMELHGQRASIGACLATGLSRFLPALGVGLLAAVFTGLGFLALIIPGVIIFCMFYVATTASVIERPGVMGALQRSRELTKGHRLEIFGILFLLGLISAVSHLVLLGIVSTKPTSLEAAFEGMRHQLYFNLGHEIIFGSLSAVMVSVTYCFLRAEKEGTSAAELAAIFD
jgi:hypothetical protein